MFSIKYHILNEYYTETVNPHWVSFRTEEIDYNGRMTVTAISGCSYKTYTDIVHIIII